MGVFRDAARGSASEERPPPKVIEVSPDAFSALWEGRPTEPVKMGLRLVPDDDLQTARAEAAKYALTMHPNETDIENATDCFNDALLRWRIARSTCSPADEREPWFQMAEDTVRFALTTEGVKAIAFEIEVFEAEQSPLFKPASDDELQDLVAILQRGAPWDAMSPAEQRGTRRLLAVVLDRFGEALARGSES